MLCIINRRFTYEGVDKKRCTSVRTCLHIKARTRGIVEEEQAASSSTENTFLSLFNATYGGLQLDNHYI